MLIFKLSLSICLSFHVANYKYIFSYSWKPTCDVFHKHEDYMQDQLTIYQETTEKDKYNTYIKFINSISLYY